MAGYDAASLAARLRAPSPKFGLEEFDPTFDLRQEAARALVAMQDQINALDQQCQGFANLNAKLKADNKDMGHSFDVRLGATRRAAKRWQAANPGNDLTWPDHADLIVWCLDQISALESGPVALVDATPKDTAKDSDLAEARAALRCVQQQCETAVYNITQREHDEAVVRSFQSIADFCARTVLSREKEAGA